MQINISIQLDPSELAETITRLAMLFASPTPLNALPSPDTPAPTSTPVLAAILPATEAASTIAPLDEWTPVATQPEREPSPLVGGPKGRPRIVTEKRPAVLPGETERPKRANTSERLKFDQFDNLVRSEMKRLSMDKRIPSHSLWNAERDQRLPTLTAICQRYDAPNLVALAAKLDMLPPLSATNGVGHHRKETTP